MTDAIEADENDEPREATEAFALETSPSHLLHRAQQMAANRSAAALREAGITLRQFSVLAAIAEEDGASQSSLVHATGIDRSTLADMVSRMEKAGLIARFQSESDARAKAVSLMPAGRKALDTAAPAVREADETLLRGLPKNRRGPFVDLLSTLIAPKPAKPPADQDDGEDRKTKPKKKDKDKARQKTKGKKKGGKKKKEKA